VVEVVGLGQSCIDHLSLAPAFPAEDSKQEFDRLLIQGGGPAATALVCLARLGRRTAFVGRVGDDDFGRFIQEGLMAEGVDTAFLRVSPGADSQYAFILANSGQGTRTVFWTRSTAGEVRPDEIPAGLIRQARVLHLDGLMASASLAAARLAREAGTAVVLDGGTLRPHSRELAGMVDHLVVSETFAQAYAPDLSPAEAVRRLTDLGPKTVVITRGGGGSVGYDGGEVIVLPAWEVEVVDTTGAGDAYHGGYIDGLLEGLDLEGRMRFAAVVAALNCTALGGRTALPRRDRVEALLRG